MSTVKIWHVCIPQNKWTVKMSTTGGGGERQKTNNNQKRKPWKTLYLKKRKKKTTKNQIVKKWHKFAPESKTIDAFSVSCHLVAVRFYAYVHMSVLHSLLHNSWHFWLHIFNCAFSGWTEDTGCCTPQIHSRRVPASGRSTHWGQNLNAGQRGKGKVAFFFLPSFFLGLGIGEGVYRSFHIKPQLSWTTVLKLSDGGCDIFLACEDFGRVFDCSFSTCVFFCFKVEISWRALNPLFWPGSVHSGLVRWDD